MKIVLAYSGGLDTSVLLSWIKDTYGNAEMIAFCANIGQEDELKGLETGTQTVRIDRGPVKVFARALLDEDPVYDGDTAPVPPTYPFVMHHWGTIARDRKSVV